MTTRRAVGAYLNDGVPTGLANQRLIVNWCSANGVELIANHPVDQMDSVVGAIREDSQNANLIVLAGWEDFAEDVGFELGLPVQNV